MLIPIFFIITGIKRAFGEDNGAPPVKRFVQPDMAAQVFRTSDTTKDLIDNKLARFFLGCNIPFNVVEHPLFNDLLQALRPGYKPPTRKALADRHLDNVAEQVTCDVKKKLDGKVVTLVEDGWSNIHNDPVVATCVSVDGNSYFVSATDTRSMPKTADDSVMPTTDFRR